MKKETHLVLQKHFEKKKSAAHGYSLRALAGHLDLSPSFLSRVFAGKKPVSYPLLLKLGKALDIDPETMANLKSSHTVQIEDSVVPRRGKSQVDSEIDTWELTGKTSFSALRNWFYLPILEFTTLENFDGSLEMISRRLGVSLPVVEIAVRELLSMGLLEQKNGRLQKTAKKLRWSTSKHLAEVRKFHGQMLQKAQDVLINETEEKDFSRRLITGITMTAHPKKVQLAKQKLAEFLHELANELTADEGTDVYHLSAQFFPLTNTKK